MMILANVISIAMLAQAPVVSVSESDVAFEDLVAYRNLEAIERIEGNDALESDDPARLINLGIAYAREGRTEEARSIFLAALEVEERVRLETATGEWVDSRRLALRALAKLDRGEFTNGTRFASR